MVKTLFLGAALLLPALSFGMEAPGCGGDAPAVQTDEQHIALSLSVGQVISISLPSNPSTGYSWSVAAQEGDAAEVKLSVIPPPEPAPGEEPLCGAPADTEARIVTMKPGQASFLLIYSRPWEKDVPPVQSLSLELSVTE